MTPEMEALGRRAVACKGWRWMPGMRVDWVAMDTGWRMLSETRSWYEREECEDGKPGGPNALPDLNDPATVGCLLALVREACSKPAVTMFWGDYWQVVYASKVEDGCADNEHLGSGDTEAEALVAALEAAP